MGGRLLPEGYVEIDRWSLKQASVKDFLVLALVGLVAFFGSLAAAGFIVGAATGSAETTIDGGTFVVGFLVGFVLGVILHEAVHGVFFLAFGGRPRFGFKPWTRFGPVFYAAAPGSYLRQAPVRRRRPHNPFTLSRLAPAVLLTAALAAALAFVAADDLLASIVTLGLRAQRRRLGGRHGHDAQGDVLSPHDPFRRHRRRIRRLRPGGGLNCSELMPTQPVHPE